MSPPGRPKGEFRSAKHEGSPARPLSRRQVLLRLSAISAALGVTVLGMRETLAEGPDGRVIEIEARRFKLHRTRSA